jgi:hypothetical protein
MNDDANIKSIPTFVNSTTDLCDTYFLVSINDYGLLINDCGLLILD